eukprot:GEMP01043868.1.p1 GENE.GEMP01043868.1~~GEMP01043868.1.p1  ORF type:complete len:408 (+),score=105.45 GEMP01043868.1:38-1261(+)
MGNWLTWPIDYLGGNDLLDNPESWTPTPQTRDALRTILADAGHVVDYHCHVVGMQEHCSGCYVHASTHQWWHPSAILKRWVFTSASAGKKQGDEHIDSVVMRRLSALSAHMNTLLRSFDGSVIHLLLPLDCAIDPATKNEDRAKTGLYVPNDYVAKIVNTPAVQAHDGAPEENDDMERLLPPEHAGKDFFRMAMSVHPYRTDAAERIAYWAQRGCKVNKWLPNSQKMDPADPLCDASYAAMKAHHITLLVHTGFEHSVSCGGVIQDFGNPLLLRRALDMGITVIAAHCASEGMNRDLDHPDQEPAHSWTLLKRLMITPEYENLLFADISALTCFRRLDTLEDVLSNITWSKLVQRGLMTAEQKVIADEIYHANPLLFDYVVKRMVKCPRTGNTFPPSVLQENPKLKL